MIGGWIRPLGSVAYAVIFLLAGYYVFNRFEEESRLKVARPLAKGQFIAASDISSTRMAQIVGHDASRDMRVVGVTIGADDVQDHVPASHPPILEAVLSVDWASADKPLNVGDPVNLCVGNDKLTLANATVNAPVCDKNNCTITVELSGVPDLLAKADTLKQLRAVKGDQDCGKPIAGEAGQPAVVKGVGQKPPPVGARAVARGGDRTSHGQKHPKHGGKAKGKQG